MRGEAAYGAGSGLGAFPRLDARTLAALFVSLALLWSVAGRLPSEVGPGGAAVAATAEETAKSSFSGLPLSFVENVGQADSRIAFSVQGSSTSLSFTRQVHGLSKSDDQHARDTVIIRVVPR